MNGCFLPTGSQVHTDKRRNQGHWHSDAGSTCTCTRQCLREREAFILEKVIRFTHVITYFTLGHVENSFLSWYIFVCLATCLATLVTDKKLDYLTNALCANLAVTIRALTGEGTHWVYTLLAGLAVMFVTLTLINVCVGGGSKAGTHMSKCSYCEQTQHHSLWQEDKVWLLEGRRWPLCSPHLHPTAEYITSYWIMFAVSCRLMNTSPSSSSNRFVAASAVLKTQQLFSCESSTFLHCLSAPPWTHTHSHPHRSHQHDASSPNTCYGHLFLTVCGCWQ